MKQKELAAALKGIVILCLVAGILLCGILVPNIGLDMARTYPELAWMFLPCLLFVWVTCIPVLVVLVLVWQMATQIARDNSFCYENAHRLKWVCTLAMVDLVLYVLGGGAAFLFFKGLPPWLLIPFFLILCIGIAIAVVSAVLSHLVQKGADMKAEQDLTI